MEFMLDCRKSQSHISILNWKQYLFNSVKFIFTSIFNRHSDWVREPGSLGLYYHSGVPTLLGLINTNPLLKCIGNGDAADEYQHSEMNGLDD